MGKKWSASRVSTYTGCPLKYKYSYVQGWKQNIDKPNEFAAKGLAFHESAEHYETKLTREEAYKILEDNIAKYKVDEQKNEDGTLKYDERGAFDNFLLFWTEYVAPMEADGYDIKKETWCSGSILRQPFCGCIDLLVEGKDDMIIYDYKSAKRAEVSGYKNQLILYAYLKGKARGWTNGEIAQKIQLRVFFPFAELEGDPSSDRMNKCVKPIKFTEKDVDKVINDYYVKALQDIAGTDWDKDVTADSGVVSFACSFCPYAGHGANKDGFPGCNKTVAAGIEPEEGIEIIKG